MLCVIKKDVNNLYTSAADTYLLIYIFITAAVINNKFNYYL